VTDTVLHDAEVKLAWELRGYWVKHTPVVVTLDEKCVITTVVGVVSQVSVTGAFAIVDGWHLPLDRVLRIARATVEDKAAYEEAKLAAQAKLAEAEQVRAEKQVDLPAS
jgi:hypothetical protein